MDMCYDGALVMPSSYAVMDAEEMTYTEAGFYLNNTQCNKVMYYSVIALGLGGTAVKLAWSVLKKHIAAGLLTLSINLGISMASTLVGIGVAAAVVSAIAMYGISFYEGIYTAQWKGTGCKFSISLFGLKKSYY